MRLLIESNDTTAFEPADSPRIGSRSSTTLRVVSRLSPADNDATCDDPGLCSSDAETWARHAAGANGFGDAPVGYDVLHAARARRALILGGIVAVAIDAAIAQLQRAQERYRQRRREAAFQEALCGLSDHLLRDLGLDRTELRAIAAHQSGELE